MTKDEMIKMAREAGFVVDEKAQQHQPNCIFHTHHMVDELLERFAAIVAAAENERLHALAMDQQGEIYGLTFARETERKIHNLVKAENKRLRELLKECKAVMKANSLFRNSITHHELCKRVSAAIKEST